MNVSTSYGMICPNCKFTVDVFATVGGDASKCPRCKGDMVPNQAAKISANANCKKCNSSFGIINSDKCPNCGTEF